MRPEEVCGHRASKSRHPGRPVRDAVWAALRPEEQGPTVQRRSAGRASRGGGPGDEQRPANPSGWKVTSTSNRQPGHASSENKDVAICLHAAQGGLGGPEHRLVDAARSGGSPCRPLPPPQVSGPHFRLPAHFSHQHFRGTCWVPGPCRAESPGSLGRQTQARETATRSSMSPRGRHTPLPGMSACP